MRPAVWRAEARLKSKFGKKDKEMLRTGHLSKKFISFFTLILISVFVLLISGQIALAIPN